MELRSSNKSSENIATTNAVSRKSSCDSLTELKMNENQLETNDQRSEKKGDGWTLYLLFCNLSIIIGSSFMFGYNLSVVNGPYVILLDWMNETIYETGTQLSEDQLNTQWSVSVTLYLIGGTVGSTWFPGFLANHIGK